MALLRGRLLAGALFAGALFGAQDIQENVNDLITPLYGAHDEALLNKIRDKYEVIDRSRKLDAEKVADSHNLAVVERDNIPSEIKSKKKTQSIKKQVLEVQHQLNVNDQQDQALEEQNIRNEIALLLILSEV